ncbi:hypothetical protein [Streptomyces sp. NPDC007063]|uniref:hypothetical protein n=1 Tax=Streptomyces sp. NPDC007063 TaxID=3364772 RepID=UPI0036C177C4
MGHELWEACPMDDVETFRRHASDVLSDTTEISGRDLQLADWPSLYASLYRERYGDQSVSVGSRVYSARYGYTGTVKRAVGTGRWLVGAERSDGVVVDVEADEGDLIVK